MALGQIQAQAGDSAGEATCSCSSQPLEVALFLGSWPLPPPSKPAVWPHSDSSSLVTSDLPVGLLLPLMRTPVITLASLDTLGSLPHGQVS